MLPADHSLRLVVDRNTLGHPSALARAGGVSPYMITAGDKEPTNLNVVETGTKRSAAAARDAC